MLDAGRRRGRLSCWVLLMVVLGFQLVASAEPVPQSGPATTTVSDTVYQADGRAAQGTLIILWPAFETASGTAVAAGTTNVTLGANGALSVPLVPNAGATPAGVYYTVVYQLGPGEVKTEYWVVPTTSPANLAAVRTTPGGSVATPPVSMQYVNSQLATVVHLAGTETITGAKTFAVNPSVPAPSSAGQVANKGYVDQSVSNSGAGNFLPTAGGTLTGPLTLPANPSAPLQASTKQYVDTGLAGKANLISGLVPANELGTGTANAGSCLLGNGTWGGCGGGGGTGNVSTIPTASQNIAQPIGTQFGVNNLANIRYVTSSWNWAQTPADNLSTPGSVTIHLNPCPLGLDTAAATNYYSYKVYISGTGTPEAVAVTGGSCAPGSASGTIAVTTANAHAAGYTVGSASSGIQEAWNDAWINDNGAAPVANALTSPYVKLIADTSYFVYGSVYLRGRGGVLDGAGAFIQCSTRDRCIYVGTTASGPFVNHHKLYNLSGSSSVNVDGAQVASVCAGSGCSPAQTNGTYLVTTATNHAFVAGDTVACEYHSQTADQRWVSPVLTVPSASTFTVSFGVTTFSAGANTFGFCNILNAFLENNSDHVALQDINMFQAGTSGNGFFSYGIVNDNDQQFIIERASNRSSSVLKNSVNWPLGAFFYQRTDQGNAGITYLHNSEITNVNCATGGGNGFVFTDSVCQGFPVYGVRYFGGLQSATFENIYQESTGGTPNPLYGISGQMGYLIQGSVGVTNVGFFPTNGMFPTFATGGGLSSIRNYFVVLHSSTLGAGQMLAVGSAQPSSGSVSINVVWPSVELQSSSGASLGTVTWDVLVTTGSSAAVPQGTGSFAIATGISGSCGTNGMCSFSDTQAAPASYTVPSPQFSAQFWFWPASYAINQTILYADAVLDAPGAVASQGVSSVSIIAGQCISGGYAPLRTPIWVSCLNSTASGGAGVEATVLQQQDQENNGPPANSKGRLSFGKQLNSSSIPNDLLTLQDGNFPVTVTTSGQRPPADANDMAIGLDQSGGMDLRSAISISSYINALPSGTNFLERLTGAGKTFNVPVTVNGNLTVGNNGTVTLPITGSGAQCLHVSAAGAVSGTGADCGSGSGSGTVTVSGGVSSQLALYSGNGSALGGDSGLTDSGTTLNYAGTGGITAASGTFSGNLTVNGQLLVAGPWMVSSPIPGAAMGPAGAGTSALGISNDGNFYISANGGTPQKVATSATSSYFTNLLQEDANDLGMYNGTAAQNLHVYSSYTNSSTWTRSSLGFDPTSAYAVLRSESLGGGAAPGLGFWINSGIKWAIDPTSNLKPWADGVYNLGTFNGPSGVGLRPATVYAAGASGSSSGFELGKFANNSYELCNDTSTGTEVNGIATLTANGCAVKPTSAVTAGVIGVVIANAGTSGTTTLARTGSAYCTFDATATVVGDYVVPSGTSGSYAACHDAGSTPPGGAQVLGRVLQATSGGVLAQMFFDMPGSWSGSGGTLANGTTAMTQAGTDNSADLATDAFAKSQLPADNTADPWITVPTISGSATMFSSSSNKAAFFGVILPFQKTTSAITYEIGSTADGTSNTYDIGIYSGTSGGTCTLKAHIGSTAGSSFSPTASHYYTVNWTGGSVTLAPGRYYLAITSSATSSTATMGGSTGSLTFAGGGSAGTVGNVSITTGGSLPSSLTCPTDSYTSAVIPAWAVN